MKKWEHGACCFLIPLHSLSFGPAPSILRSSSLRLLPRPASGFYDVQALAEWLLTQRDSRIKHVYQK